MEVLLLALPRLVLQQYVLLGLAILMIAFLLSADSPVARITCTQLIVCTRQRFTTAAYVHKLRAAKRAFVLAHCFYSGMCQHQPDNASAASGIVRAFVHSRFE